MGRRVQWGSLAGRPGGAALRGSLVAQPVLTPVPTWVALIAVLMLAVVSVLRFVGLISAAMPATLPSTLAILDVVFLLAALMHVLMLAALMAVLLLVVSMFVDCTHCRIDVG